MSWATRRKLLYITGVILFFAVVIGGPLSYWYFSTPATCDDGIQNHGETSIDKGGPCPLLDEHTLVPYAVTWTRTFQVTGGLYSVVTYVENPNTEGGVFMAPYLFRLYDERNILVAEREGFTAILPGTVTPVFEGGIDTGSRNVARAYFEFTAPLVWQRLQDISEPIDVSSKTITDEDTMPRLTAVVENTSVAPLRDIQFVAVIFDTAGNAFAASSTIVPLLLPGERRDVVFTWPDPFAYVSGKIDVLPILKPVIKKK